MISDLTYKVVAYSDLKNINADDCIDWAIEMLQENYENPSLLILAAISKPANQFEVMLYLKKAISELNLIEKTGDEATLSYCSYYITKIARGEDVKRNLSMVCNFGNSRDNNKLIHDFYLLYWAWDDLDYGNEYQSYWPGANKKNIEKVAIDAAKKWILENEKHFTQNTIHSK